MREILIPDAVAVGYIAAALTSISFIPQAIKTIRTRDTRGISAGMYATFVAGTAMWLWYGVAIKSLPVTASSIVTVLLSGVILLIKLRYSKNSTSL